MGISFAGLPSRAAPSYKWGRNTVLRGVVHREDVKGELRAGVGVGRARMKRARSRLGRGLGRRLPGREASVAKTGAEEAQPPAS